jgi:LmbE family N-acetylglucosaminyl deacetylase
MLSLSPALAERPRFLFLGAHSDDIELGCGGTAMRLFDERPDAEVCWVVFGGAGSRGEEARASAAELLARLERPDVRVFDFPDSYFPAHSSELKRCFESLKAFGPHVVFTHCRHDLHQDHELVSKLTANTFRDHLVLEYEIPKYDADLRQPNVFVPLPTEACRLKTEHLHRHFRSQRSRDWFDQEVFLGLLRIRGVECRSPSGYAEAFYGRKLRLAWGAGALAPGADPRAMEHAEPGPA